MSDIRVDSEVFQRLQEVLADFFEQAEEQLQATATEVTEHRNFLSEEARADFTELDELDAADRTDDLDGARARLELAEGAMRRFDTAVEEYEAEEQSFRALLDDRAGQVLGELSERVSEYLDVRRPETLPIAPSVDDRPGAPVAPTAQAPSLGVGLSVGVPGVPLAGVEIAVNVPLATPESEDADE